MLALAYQGRTDEAVRAAQVPSHLPAAELATRFCLLRLQMWRLIPFVPGRPVEDLIGPLGESGKLAGRLFESLERMLATATLGAEDREFLKGFRSAGQSPRMQAASAQFYAEALMFVGAWDEALVAVAQAIADGSEDFAWFEYCPLAAPLRGRAEWLALRGPMAERAAAVQAAVR
ncbi:MAG: hypothetical protein HY902_10815 [Deltaproteobacteria bacterium]|nr:hypothetical protein [Deltaproteobacteria bacterium]